MSKFPKFEFNRNHFYPLSLEPITEGILEDIIQNDALVLFEMENIYDQESDSIKTAITHGLDYATRQRESSKPKGERDISVINEHGWLPITKKLSGYMGKKIEKDTKLYTLRITHYSYDGFIQDFDKVGMRGVYLDTQKKADWQRYHEATSILSDEEINCVLSFPHQHNAYIDFDYPRRPMGLLRDYIDTFQ